MGFGFVQPIVIGALLAEGLPEQPGMIQVETLAELGRLSPAGLAELTLDELRRIAAFAAGAAAITCTRRGPDLPRRAELPSTM